DKFRHYAGIPYSRHDLFHHQLPIPLRIVLSPLNSFDVISEVLGVLREVRQVLIRKIDEKLPHVPACQFDEVASYAISNATRPAVQHEPDRFRLVQAHLDEMIAGAYGP